MAGMNGNALTVVVPPHVGFGQFTENPPTYFPIGGVLVTAQDYWFKSDL